MNRLKFYGKSFGLLLALLIGSSKCKMGINSNSGLADYERKIKDSRIESYRYSMDNINVYRKRIISLASHHARFTGGSVVRPDGDHDQVIEIQKFTQLLRDKITRSVSNQLAGMTVKQLNMTSNTFFGRVVDFFLPAMAQERQKSQLDAMVKKISETGVAYVMKHIANDKDQAKYYIPSLDFEFYPFLNFLDDIFNQEYPRTRKVDLINFKEGKSFQFEATLSDYQKSPITEIVIFDANFPQPAIWGYKVTASLPGRVYFSRESQGNVEIKISAEARNSKGLSEQVPLVEVGLSKIDASYDYGKRVFILANLNDFDSYDLALKVTTSNISIVPILNEDGNIYGEDFETRSWGDICPSAQSTPFPLCSNVGLEKHNKFIKKCESKYKRVLYCSDCRMFCSN